MAVIHFLNSEVSDNKQNINIKKKIKMPFIFLKIKLQQIFERQLAPSDMIPTEPLL